MGIEKRVSQIERAMDLQGLQYDLTLLSDDELDELYQLSVKHDAGVVLTAEEVAVAARISEKYKIG